MKKNGWRNACPRARGGASRHGHGRRLLRRELPPSLPTGGPRAGIAKGASPSPPPHLMHWEERCEAGPATGPETRSCRSQEAPRPPVAGRQTGRVTRCRRPRAGGKGGAHRPRLHRRPAQDLDDAKDLVDVIFAGKQRRGGEHLGEHGASGPHIHARPIPARAEQQLGRSVPPVFRVSRGQGSGGRAPHRVATWWVNSPSLRPLKTRARPKSPSLSIPSELRRRLLGLTSWGGGGQGRGAREGPREDGDGSHMREGPSRGGGWGPHPVHNP